MHALEKKSKKVIFYLCIMALGIFMFCLPVMAASPTTAANPQLSATSASITSLVSLMCSIFKYVGTAIFVWSVIQLILATKRSDADSKAEAIQAAVCGITMMGMASIINTFDFDDSIGVVNSDSLG